MSDGSQLIHLLNIYKWTLLTTPLLALALALVGMHLMARGQSLQTLVVSQGSSLGVLLGIALNVLWHSHGAGHDYGHDSTHGHGHASLGYSSELESGLWPLLFGLIVAGLSYLWSEKLRWRQNPSLAPASLLMAFALLMALSHVTASLSPHLETHMSAIYFGDLATLSDREALSAGLLSFLSLGALFYWRRLWLRQSFNLAVLGPSQTPSWSFTLLALLLISLSIQYLGLLFTLGGLFIAPSLLARRQDLTHQGYQLRLTLATLLGSTSGFLASLLWPTLPTAPAVVLGLAVASEFFRITSRWATPRSSAMTKNTV